MALKRVFAVEVSLNGSTWNEIASFADKSDAEQFAQAERFSYRALPIKNKILIRVIAHMVDPSDAEE